MIAKKIVSREYIKDIPNWEKDYLKSMKGNLSEQQIELLTGRPIRSYEGMIYGQMYRHWKDQNGVNW